MHNNLACYISEHDKLSCCSAVCLIQASFIDGSDLSLDA